MNLLPDSRQLVSTIKLSIINAPESGFFTGEYSATSQAKPAENTNVLNYDFEPLYTNPEGIVEKKYSSRLQKLNSFQSARIPEVNTSVSASSCTFAFGGIVPNEVHPNFNKLKGPAYNVEFVDNPRVTSTKRTKKISSSKALHLPQIPFSDKGNVLTTYNIWNIVNGGTQAIKYIGPYKQNTNSGTLKTINDPNGGSSVEISSIDQITYVERIFATSYDAVYQKEARIFNPDGNDYPINARGDNGGNGFHINFSASNVNQSDSAFSVYFAPVVADDRYYNDFEIQFKIDKKPIIKIYDPSISDYKVVTAPEAPVFDKNNMHSYDIFVHFVGPILLIGFTSDITKWNSIVPSDSRECWCPPSTKISLGVSNLNLKFRYSAIIFNNFNNDQDEFTNNQIISQFILPQNLANIDTLTDIFTSFESASYRINPTPGNTGFRDRTFQNKEKNPEDKNISYYADHRLSDAQFNSQFIETKQRNSKEKNFPRYDYVFKLFYNTTIEGPAFLQVEMPHAGVLAASPNRSAESSTTFKNINAKSNAESGYGFINPPVQDLFIPVADISEFLLTWNVSCQNDGGNSCIIKKTATVTLKNLDTSLKGYKVINAIENNLICITIDAGYLNGPGYCYFQGFITNVEYQRTGSDSTFTLTCVDIMSYTLDNIYFEKNMIIAGMRHDFAIDSLIAASGFWTYYYRDNTNIRDIDLRLNSQSVNNQDLIKCSPTQTIYPKIKSILERLNRVGGLPVMRWAENFGFVLTGRYRDDTIDNDLKFTGIVSDPAANVSIINYNQNALVNQNVPLSDPGWHGLITDSFTISTDMKSLAAGVKAFASSITGFLADERYNPGFYPADPRDYLGETLLDKLSAKKDLLNADKNPFAKPYVGFRKYKVSSEQRNTIPDQRTLERITDELEKVIATPQSEVSFSCYVTKPLTFHGTFVIQVFVVDPKTIDYTDKYIYERINYVFDKSQNVITANVTGINIPFLINDI